MGASVQLSGRWLQDQRIVIFCFENTATYIRNSRLLSNSLRHRMSPIVMLDYPAPRLRVVPVAMIYFPAEEH
jgi:hypothetical protein